MLLWSKYLVAKLNNTWVLFYISGVCRVDIQMLLSGSRCRKVENHCVKQPTLELVASQTNSPCSCFDLLDLFNVKRRKTIVLDQRFVSFGRKRP